MTTTADAPTTTDVPAADAPDAPSAAALLARAGITPAATELTRLEALRVEAEEQAALVHAVTALRYVDPGLVWSVHPADPAPSVLDCSPEGAVA